MGIRQWASRSPQQATVVAIVLLIVALGSLAWQFRGPGAPDSSVYYWDLETDEHFVAPAQTPPVEAPSGGEGVRAILYSCGECTPNEWFGYLQTHTPEYARAMEDPELFEQMDPAEQQRFAAQGRLVRPLDGAEWLIKGSREGQLLEDQMYERCGPGERPTQCVP